MRYLLYLAALIVVFGVLVWFISLPDMSNTAAMPSLMPKWDDQVYGLDDGEVVRLVAPPFTVTRAQAPTKSKPVFGAAFAQVVFETRPTGVVRWGASTRAGTIASAISWCSRRFPGDMNGSDFDVPGALARLIVDGDWVMNNEVPVERRLAAVESIVSQATRRSLMIEKRLAEQDVIVARGKWIFHPLESPDESIRDGIQMSADDPVIKPASRQTYSKPAEFLNMISRFTGKEVLDESDRQWPYTIAWFNHTSAQRAVRNPAARSALLANLQKQTSLTFTEEKRPMPAWFVREVGASTRPTSR